MLQNDFIKIIKEKNGSSGKMYSEKYVKNNYPEIFNDIIDFCKNKLLDLPFKEKVYHYVHNLDKIIYCSNPNCNNITKFKNSTLGYSKYCSTSCISNDPKIKKIKEDKSYKKYGTKAPAMNSNIKNKIIKTNNEKYGSNSPMQNNKIRKKSIETLIKNYGVDNPNKSEKIKEKSTKTLMQNYGVDNPKKSEKINNKIKETMLLRYGVEHALQNEKIKLKSKENQLLTLAKKIKDYYKEYDILSIDNKNKKYTMKCDNNHTFDIDYTLLNSRRRTNTIICTECNPINKSISGLEIEMIQFIEKNYNGLIIFNDRDIIGKELDIYMPDLNLAFEFNGLWWHNEINKPDNYHLEKTNLCVEKNIQLIHIWEDDWIYKKDIIKSMILNKLNKTPNKIFARKCEIKKILDKKIIKNFLEKNHIQGYITSKINIGLFYNEELISLMTFGNKRIVMNDKSMINEWELSRFCNRLNTNVVGGASKLFKYFINNYDPTEVITYANRSYSYGILYEKLNFKFSHITNPNYYYIVDKIKKHRFTYRKNKLIKDGFDPSKTEHEIMIERKIYRIYDSGQLKFIWINKKKGE